MAVSNPMTDIGMTGGGEVLGVAEGYRDPFYVYEVHPDISQKYKMGKGVANTL
jgi:hypothetical protein